MKKKTFFGHDGPYLTVYTLLDWKTRNGTRWSIAFHHFHRGDEDPHAHDHPFDFWSLILWGGYEEHIRTGGFWSNRVFQFPMAGQDWVDQWTVIIRRPLSWAYRWAEVQHRVTLRSKTCWTLCIKRQNCREWGFWRDDEFVPWRKYINDKGLEPL